MDGLITYAEIFSSWVQSLSVMWSSLNFNCYDVVEQAIEMLSSNPDASAAIGFLNLIKLLLDIFGFSDLTILGLIFSCMGAGFGLYFAIVFIKWILNIIK